MDIKTLELLEFPQVRELLAQNASFSASRELALNLQPLAGAEQISLLLDQCKQARELLNVEPNFSIGGVHDVREWAKLASIGKVLEPLTLLEVQESLAAMSQLRARLKHMSEEFPLLWKIADNISELTALDKAISACITPNAELYDHASPGLARVRNGLRETREHLLERLNSFMSSTRGRRIVQEPIITEREGRYVIPVKIDMQKNIKGVVHDVSNTGASVFMEPLATLEMGNHLRELVVEEQREVERILQDLSAQVGAHIDEITRSIELTAELDLALAKAHFAQKLNATEPLLSLFNTESYKTERTSSTPAGDSTSSLPSVGEIRVRGNIMTSPSPCVEHGAGSSLSHQGRGKDMEKSAASHGVLKLVNARHPLIGKKAVPLTLEIGRDYSVIIITGPNTGGKTVALKTVGLLSLMALAGMPIPAAPESRIPLFDGVYADIGDEQSIEQTLSTFSWHMGNVKRIAAQATGRSLVLLDELGTSTDPVEGSALARSILLYFLNCGAMAVATTHLSDLKAFAHTTKGLQNASLDFDLVTLMPTYHLTMGVPGGSNALATATRLGLPAEIVARAREMLTSGSQELESLIHSLMKERLTMQALREKLDKEQSDVAKRSAELEARLKDLKEEEKKMLQEQRDRVVQEVAELHHELREASAMLRKQKTHEAVAHARSAVSRVQDKLRSERWQAGAGGDGGQEAVATGDSVWVKDAGIWATVLSVSEAAREVEVQSGRLRLKLGLDSISKGTPPASGTAAVTPPKIKQPQARAVAAELDLRGKRADEVEPELDSYLNAASLAGLKEARIIHGTATGTVRKIVRDYLAGHALVTSFRSGGQGEGGDGVTMVKL